MKKILYILIIVLLGGSFFFSCNKGKAKVTIGIFLPLTGNASQYGVTIKNGIDLAYSESSLKDKVKIIYEDDKGEPKTAVSIVNKFLHNDNVDLMIGGAMSSIASSVIPIADKNKKVLLSPFATASSLFQNEGYFYSLLPSDDYEGNFMANYVYSNNIDSLGILYINTDYGAGIASAFMKGCNAKGLKTIFSAGYQEGEMDFKTQIAKMKNLKVNAVYLPGYYAETSIILRQMKELGADFKILGSSGFYDPKFLEQANNFSEGIMFCYPAFENDTTVLFQKFIHKYETIYMQKPDIFAIQGYDCFKLIESILLKNKIQVNYNSELKNLKNFQGVNSIINFSQNGSVEKDLNIYIIKNGKFEKVK